MEKGSGDDNRDNHSYLAFARTIITVTPTLCHGKEYDATKFYTTKNVEYYGKHIDKVTKNKLLNDEVSALDIDRVI